MGATTRTGLLTALPREARGLLRRLDPPRTEDSSTAPASPPPELRVLRLGQLAGRPVAVGVTGDGHRAARRGMAAFLEAVPFSRVLCLGVAGGLTPDLGPGALVSAREVRDEAGGIWRPAPEMRDALGRLPGVESGVVVTSRRLALTPAERRRVWRRAGGAPPETGLAEGAPAPNRRAPACAPAVVDVETSHWAEVAGSAGVAWAVVRAVSDAWNESLPGFLEACRDEGGSMRTGRVAWGSLFRPSALPALLRMRRRVAGCSEALADLAELALRRGAV